MDRFEEMAERVQLDMESYALRQSIDGRRRVIAEALRATYERGAEEDRAKGREDVGKYSNAIGRIEAGGGGVCGRCFGIRRIADADHVIRFTPCPSCTAPAGDGGEHA